MVINDDHLWWTYQSWNQSINWLINGWKCARHPWHLACHSLRPCNTRQRVAGSDTSWHSHTPHGTLWHLVTPSGTLWHLPMTSNGSTWSASAAIHPYSQPPPLSHQLPPLIQNRGIETNRCNPPSIQKQNDPILVRFDLILKNRFDLGPASTVT